MLNKYAENTLTEDERIKALRDLSILDTPDEPRFDRITRLAAKIAGTPIALISLVDEHRQWFKSRVGLEACETDRSAAFCDHTIRQTEPMIVPDATQDHRFKANPLVTGAPFIRFYAGFPLILDCGEAVGTLCVIDIKSRILSIDQKEAMTDLAAIVVDEFDLHRRSAQREEEVDGARKRMRVLEETRNYYNSILNACNEAIATYKPLRGDDGAIYDFVLRDCNDAAHLMRGTTRESLIGGRLTELVPNLTPEYFARYSAVIETGEPDEFYSHYNDGHYDDWFRISAARNSGGELVLLLSVITEQKRTERRLRRSRDALESFTAAVSHDLKTPLGHISGFVELIAEDLGPDLSDQNKEFMRYVTQGVDQMRRLIDAMQKHARLGQIVIDRQRVDLAELIGDVLRRSKAKFDEIQATVTLGPMPHVSGDRVLLDQLLSNLISNAIRYRSPDRPLILDIQAEQGLKSVKLRLSDNGIGIPASSHEKIFNLFHRAAPKTNVEEGLGLGLAMCQAIVNAHSGAIKSDETRQEGAQFIVELPLGKSSIEI